MVDVLHSCKCVLLFVIGSDIGSAGIIETTSALESFVIVSPVVWYCLSLAGAMLQQVILISKTDHVLVIDLLLQVLLANAALRRPWIDKRLLLVICLLLMLGVQRFAIASSRHFAKLVIWQLPVLVIVLAVIFVASSFLARPVFVDIS